MASRSRKRAGARSAPTSKTARRFGEAVISTATAGNTLNSDDPDEALVLPSGRRYASSTGTVAGPVYVDEDQVMQQEEDPQPEDVTSAQQAQAAAIEQVQEHLLFRDSDSADLRPRPTSRNNAATLRAPNNTPELVQAPLQDTETSHPIAPGPGSWPSRGPSKRVAKVHARSTSSGN